ncbi:MAG TPA: glutamine phosphoribosylpyrophosphate amidotransferase [Isosphaeraceae bacterium]|jgi:glutamine phosphoribosylpyrophosphate amidotransferase|nr:glutamine phosphoribosylpyrophosphate amidotransferase [Isosphaeraceae bacterium]
MCGIVGLLDKTNNPERRTGELVLAMLRALGCRGPDSAGMALMQSGRQSDGAWTLRIAPAGLAEEALGALNSLGRVESPERQGETLRLRFHPQPGVSPDELERYLGARRGGLEVLCLGEQLDLVKQVGSPDALEATFGVSEWRGPLAIGHTRMSTESRIDLSHSQPFWAHGVPDVATVHNGHVTNYHQLRRQYHERGVTFYTDNDSEVIGVYLRDRVEQGRSLQEALADSVTDLDGSFCYLVVSPDGLGMVRDRFGFKPLVVTETDEFVAVATEEIALRRALPGRFRVFEPPPGRASWFALADIPVLI